MAILGPSDQSGTVPAGTDPHRGTHGETHRDTSAHGEVGDQAQSAPILVPLDGSALAERAISWATIVAYRRRVPLLLLRVVEPWMMPVDSLTTISGATVEDLVVETDVAQAIVYLAQQKAALQAAHPGLVVHTDVRLGSAASQILAVDAEHHVQMVVLTTHGRTGLRRWIRGSVAEKILRHGVAPVLLIRPWDTEGSATGAVGAMGEAGASGVSIGRRVLVSLDGSALAADALPLALKLVEEASGHLCLAMVVDSLHHPPGYAPEKALALARSAAQRYLDAVAARVRAAGVSASMVVLAAEDVAGALVDYAVIEGVDVMVMSTHGRGGLGRWLYGSVADRVAHAARMPVLLYRPQAAIRRESEAVQHTPTSPGSAAS